MSSDAGGIGEATEEFDATRLALVLEDLPLAVDFIDPASDRSPPPPSTFDSTAAEALGLSFLSALPLPGIFDRMEPRNERTDSLVSDLLNEG